MDAELKALEEKITQLVELCQRLRVQNSELRQQLAAAYNQNKQLTEKITAAKTRLEALLKQIPAKEE